MFVASYHNTMRNARKMVKPPSDEPVVTIDAMRKRKHREFMADLSRQKKAQEAEILEQRNQADFAIAQANLALARYRKSVAFEVILRRVCRATDVSLMDVFSDRQTKRIVLARQGFFYWACRVTRRSITDVGRYMNRDHTTAMHGRDAYVEKRAKMGRTLRRLR